MNLNNNCRITSSTIAKTTSNNFKALFMGILLIATTIYLMTSSTNGIVFAQDSIPVKMTLSDLPKQTADASTQVSLSLVINNDYRGSADINIPGIGSGHVIVTYITQLNGPPYFVSVSNLPGQIGTSDTPINSEEGQLLPALIDIPGIGTGTLMVN